MADINRKWPWPANVGLLGTHLEEVRELHKRVEKNPDASPMPELGPARLLNPSKNAETLRVGEPQPVVDPTNDGATFALAHVVLRRVLMRMRRRSAVLFDEAVEAEPLEDLPLGRREQMRRMLARERALLETLDRYNSLAEDVYMRLLANSKG